MAIWETFWFWFSLLVYALGIAHALHALMNTRTAQGTTAWIVSLVAFPWAAVPLYWIFGRGRFSGYIEARRSDNKRLRSIDWSVADSIAPYIIAPEGERAAFLEVLGQLASLPLTQGNHTKLLIDGKATFDSLFGAIEKAKNYVLIEFFIVKNDRLGEKLKELLVRKSSNGVRIYFLYDQIGSRKLSRRYLSDLKEAGIFLCPFRGRFWLLNFFQINFRNHRKIAIIDGEKAFIGGLNIGDEYLGRSKIGPWRDTHFRLIGPSVLATQLAFVEDWYWATGALPELSWQVVPHEANLPTLILPSGPADSRETMRLTLVSMANEAKFRLWITTPYFVPDEGVLVALQAAALRGVDVRILLPAKPDQMLVWLSAFSYIPETIPLGIHLYHYTKGFLHQKVILIDDDICSVGTANIDNRSLRLNFEITAIVPSKIVASQVEKMLEEDFAESIKLTMFDFVSRSWLFKLASRLARLLAPVQ